MEHENYKLEGLVSRSSIDGVSGVTFNNITVYDIVDNRLALSAC